MTSAKCFKRLIVCVPACFITLFLGAQNFTVSGTVKQKSSGETLIGVTIGVVEKPGIGVTTNAYGFYSLSLPEGAYTLRFSYVGYAERLMPVMLKANTTINVELLEAGSIEEVVVTSKRNPTISRATMGTEMLNMKEAAKIPVVFGEKIL